MPLTRDQKTEILDQLTEDMKQAKAVVFADFSGLTVKDMKAMRDDMRKQGVKFQVSKKTLIKIAAKNAGYDAEIPNEVVEGSVGAALSMEDEIAAAKILFNLAKKNQNLKLRGALFEGRVLSIAETKALATIPSKEELLAKTVYLFKSPIQRFHGVLHNTLAGFVRALDQIREKQEKAA